MLEWNVYNESFNKKEMQIYNVFKHGGFLKGLTQMFKNIKKEEIAQLEKYEQPLTLKEANKFNNYMEEFENEILRKECLYYFWGKCEYEIVVTSWPPYINVECIDKLKAEVEEHSSKYNWKQLQINVPLTIGEKISIYDQLRLNWESFKSYVFDHEKEIKKEYNYICKNNNN